jgi:hypothetical protein
LTLNPVPSGALPVNDQPSGATSGARRVVVV